MPGTNNFLMGGGAMGRRIAAFDWSATSFGAIESWPAELRTATALCLNSQFSAAVYWGADWRMLYNDDFVAVLGERPDAIGRTAAEVWGDYWPAMRAEFDQVLSTGAGITIIDKRFDLSDEDRPREEYWNYSFTPIHDATGTVAGMFAGARQTTDAVVQRRFDALIRALDEQLARMDAVDDIVDSALRLIGEHLDAKRTGFGEIDRDAGMLEIRRCWTNGEMPDICGTYPLGLFGAISAELAGGTSVQINDNLADPRTRDPATVEVYKRAGLRSGIVTPIIDRGAYRGGVFVQDNVPRAWTAPQVALAEAAGARLWQAIVRARAQASLRDSEERFRLIFEQANDIIFTADIDQRITAANPAGVRALGYDASDIVGRSISDFVSPEDFTQTTAMLQHKLDKGGHTRHEVGVTGRDGKVMRWENDSSLIVDRDSRPIGLLSISRDVTARRAFEERRELLIHELNHRVKNTLSLVQGIARQSFRAGIDPAAAPPRVRSTPRSACCRARPADARPMGGFDACRTRARRHRTAGRRRQPCHDRRAASDGHAKSGCRTGHGAA